MEWLINRLITHPPNSLYGDLMFVPTGITAIQDQRQVLECFHLGVPLQIFVSTRTTVQRVRVIRMVSVRVRRASIVDSAHDILDQFEHFARMTMSLTRFHVNQAPSTSWLAKRNALPVLSVTCVLRTD